MSRFGQAGGRGSRSASLCPLLACLVAPALAGASDSAHKLIDGSKPPSVPKVLRESGGRLTMTRVRAETVASIRGVLTHCPESDQALHPGRVIERVGVTGRSVTFLVDHTTIAGCDRSPRARSIFGRWCGASGWHFARGRVSDPRLDVCYDRRSRPVIAFGWINAVRRAKWIVVDQPGYREVYPVAGGLPVRVSTISGLGRAGGAIFHTAQYDGAGVLLVRRKVVAAIAS